MSKTLRVESHRWGARPKQAPHRRGPRLRSEEPQLAVDDELELELEPLARAASFAASWATRAGLSAASCAGSVFDGPCGPAPTLPAVSSASRCALSPASCVTSAVLASGPGGAPRCVAGSVLADAI